MIIFEVVISEGNNHRHGSLEGVHQVLQLLSYGIRWQVLLHTVANLRKLVCLSLNVLSINIRKLLLNPCISLLLPLM